VRPSHPLNRGGVGLHESYEPCGMILCSKGVTATIALSVGSPRQHKVLRCSTAPIGPSPTPLCSLKQYQQCQPLNRARGKPDVMARCHSFGRFGSR
jgi:hypothetical protein